MTTAKDIPSHRHIVSPSKEDVEQARVLGRTFFGPAVRMIPGSAFQHSAICGDCGAQVPFGWLHECPKGKSDG